MPGCAFGAVPCILHLLQGFSNDARHGEPRIGITSPCTTSSYATDTSTYPWHFGMYEMSYVPSLLSNTLAGRSSPFSSTALMRQNSVSPPDVRLRPDTSLACTLKMAGKPHKPPLSKIPGPYATHFCGFVFT